MSKGYVVFDLETSIKSALKRKATPFGGLNIIVAIGYKGQHDEQPTGSYFGHAGAEDGWLAPMLEGRNFLVGFNIKFDVLHGICQGPLNRKAWMDYLVRGGQLWDCQLAEYLIGGQAQDVQMCSLDDTAPKYGGNLKNDEVKSLWAAGVETADIDMNLLMEYLVGVPGDANDLGDIGNTEKIFTQQVALLRARGGLRSALLNMSALASTIEMEFNGMYVDLPWALEHATKLEAQLAEADKELAAFIPSDLPFEFKWTSRYHRSALIFGGRIGYVAKEEIIGDDGNLVYFQKDEVHYLLDDGNTMDVEQYEHGMSQGMELPFRVVYAGGKNKGEFKTKKVKVPDVARGPKLRNVDKVYTFKGYTTPDPKWESSTPGVYSTNAATMEELSYRKDVEFLAVLSKRTDLHKDLSTYFIVTDPDTGEQKGMLTLVGADGIIHHSIHMNRTITARLSSSDPNLQNVSKGSFKDGVEEGSQIKRAFVSRFKDGVIIQSDFTSLEIYVQACLTMCRQLIEDLKAGLDMHINRAVQAWARNEGLTYEDVVAILADKTHPDHKKWKDLRQAAKVFSFQRAYGAGVKKIAATTGMSEQEVQDLIDAELKMYPELQEYIDEMTEAIKKNRKGTSITVPHPEVPGVICQLGRSHFFTPDGKMYTYREHPTPKGMLKRRPGEPPKLPQGFSPTEIKNYVVQGTGGEWAKAAMHLALLAFYERGNFGGRALLVNQVHDALYVDAAPEVALDAAALLHACMLEASNYMAYWFNWHIPLGVPTETKMGANMMEENDPPEGFHEKMQYYRTWVRDALIAGHIPNYEKE